MRSVGGRVTNSAIVLLGAAVATCWYACAENLPGEIATRPLLDVWLRVMLLVWVGGMATALRCRLRPDTRALTIAVLTGLLLFSMVTLVLKGTPYSFSGVQGDSSFRTACVTKSAASPRLGDYYYSSLPAFYPPLYFHALGRIAAAAGIEPYRMLKLGALVTAFLLPLLTVALWTPHVGPAAGSVIVLTFLIQQLWTSPHEWISLVAMIPWWAGSMVSRPGASGRGKRLLWLILLGFTGSLIVQTYYYWFFVCILWLGIEPLLSRVLRSDTVRRSTLGWRAAVLVGVALFSAPYWFPLLHSILKTPHARSLQNRYFTPSHVPVPFPFFEPCLRGLLELIGLAYLIARSSKEPIPRLLIGLVLACYAWIGFGYVAVLAGHPVMANRADVLLEHALLIGCALAISHVLTRPGLAAATASRWRGVFVLGGALVMGSLGQDTAQRLADHPYVDDARKERYPHRLLSGVLGEDTRASYGRIVLTDRPELCAYAPVFSWIPWNAYYSHPAGRFGDRVDFLERLGQVQDPRLFAGLLMNNRYDRIDDILLSVQDSCAKLSLYVDNFPQGGRWRSLLFPLSLFSERYFAVSRSDTMLVVRPRYAQRPFEVTDVFTRCAGEGARQRDLLDLWRASRQAGRHLGLDSTHPTIASLDRRIANLAEWRDVTLLERYEVQVGLGLDPARLRATDPRFLNVDVVLHSPEGLPRLHVLGYAATRDSTTGSLRLETYCTALSSLPSDYVIWIHGRPHDRTHLPDQDRLRGFVGWDHMPVIPTSRWEPGRVYLDSVPLTGPRGEYDISMGLWLPKDRRRLLTPAGEAGIQFGSVVIP